MFFLIVPERKIFIFTLSTRDYPHSLIMDVTYSIENLVVTG